MAFLGRLNFASDEVNVFIDFYNQYIGFDLNGEQIGCGFADKVSGKLTLNAGMIRLEKQAVSLTVNVRYPVSCTSSQVYDAILPAVNRYDMGLIRGKDREPIFMDPNSPMIQTLVDVYRKHTGDTESHSMVIGGGTYARCAKNVVAFGGLFPGDEDLMHQKNECIAVDKVVLLAKIYAEAIYRLAEME